MSKAFAFSDVHGHPEFIDRFVEHARPEADDTIVYLGDYCDRGPRSFECLKKLDELGVVKLLGNHELAHLFMQDIGPSYLNELDEEGLFQNILANDILDKNYRIAYEVDGILLTHGGLSNLLVKDPVGGMWDMGQLHTMHANGLLSAKTAAKFLNERLDQAFRMNRETGDISVVPDRMFFDYFSPLWFFPFNNPDDRKICGYYDGFPQVIGHTWKSFNTKANLARIAEAGVTLVDTEAEKHKHTRFIRYAVIENGVVTLVEAYL